MEKYPSLIAIYNTFDGEEILPYSVKSIRDHVDFILIVAQTVSNYGEQYEGGYNMAQSLADEVILYVPDLKMSGAINETRKRNIGLEYAKKHKFGHYLFLDNDEIYEEFGKAKQQFFYSCAKGSVCQLWTYFKKPTLRLDKPENYFVPFIHELHPDTVCGMQPYPFYVDPTRRVNEKNVVLIDEFMHHYSYVRADIERKIRNSSAKANLEKSAVLKDYYSDLHNGSYLNYYQQKLVEVPNIFGIEI